MKNTKIKNEKGFTLIELSIVLVIIGLLVGAIVGGQAIMGAAKISAVVTQMGQFDIAVTNFQTKFDHLPGDSNVHTPVGDADGYIENSTINAWLAPPSATHVSHDEEVANFWKHLQDSGFLSSYPTFSADTSSGLDAGVHMPQIKGYDKAAAIPFLDENFLEIGNEYWLCDFSATTDTDIYTTDKRKAIFTPVEARNIDIKMDDGITGRGGPVTSEQRIRASNFTDSEAGGADGRCWNATSQDVYLANDNKECCLFIRLLSRTEGTQY